MRSPSRPGSPVGGGSRTRSLAAAARSRALEHADGGAAVSPGFCSIEQVAGDTVGLIRALAVQALLAAMYAV